MEVSEGRIPNEDERILTLRNRHWSKKINGETIYFGKNYDAAVRKYLEQKPFLEAGIPVPAGRGPTVGKLLNEFLANRLNRLEQGRLSPRTYEDYVAVTDIISATLKPKTPLDFLRAEDFDRLRESLTKGVEKIVSQKTLDRRLGYARAVLRFASIDNRLVKHQLPFTGALACVPKIEIRKERACRPSRLLQAVHIRMVIDHASVKFKAAILLAINGGFNNSDIANLTLGSVSPVPDVLTYPRIKTFFMRQTPLWPETIEAIENAKLERIESEHPYLFLSSKNKPYFAYSRHDQISKTFYRYLNELGIYQPGRNFGALRTTFAEVAKEVSNKRDTALKALMGHSDGSTLYEDYAVGVYAPKLRRITDHVRHWLYDKEQGKDHSG